MQGLRSLGDHFGQGQTAPQGRGRSAVLGAALGLLLAWAWLQHAREALAPLQAQEQGLQTQLRDAQAAARRATEQARQAAAAQEAHERIEAAQHQARRLRAVLEGLAQPASVRLTLLRWDATGWTVQGHADPAQVPAWASARSLEAFAGVPAQLVELSAAPQAGVPAGHARFVLRWPAPSVAQAPPRSPPVPAKPSVADPGPGPSATGSSATGTSASGAPATGAPDKGRSP